MPTPTTNLFASWNGPPSMKIVPVMIAIVLFQAIGLFAFITAYEDEMWRVAANLKPRPWQEMILEYSLALALPAVQAILAWQQIAPGLHFRLRSNLSWKWVSILGVILSVSGVLWIYSVLRLAVASE
jgi:hypothetical protein